MATRGRRDGEYVTDGGTGYKMKIDRDRFDEVGFGWGTPDGPRPKLPRGFKPRHVTGISLTTGYRGTAVVPHTESDLWTGGASTFLVEATDETIDTMTVIERIGEKPSLP
jgi:hypothetical protein